MSGIYQKQVNSGSVAAPSAGRTLISVNESGELFTKDSSGNVIVYPTSSAGGGGGGGGSTESITKSFPAAESIDNGRAVSVGSNGAVSNTIVQVAEYVLADELAATGLSSIEATSIGDNKHIIAFYDTQSNSLWAEAYTIDGATVTTGSRLGIGDVYIGAGNGKGASNYFNISSHQSDKALLQYYDNAHVAEGVMLPTTASFMVLNVDESNTITTSSRQLISGSFVGSGLQAVNDSEFIFLGLDAGTMNAGATVINATDGDVITPAGAYGTISVLPQSGSGMLSPAGAFNMAKYDTNKAVAGLVRQDQSQSPQYYKVNIQTLEVSASVVNAYSQSYTSLSDDIYDPIYGIVNLQVSAISSSSGRYGAYYSQNQMSSLSQLGLIGISSSLSGSQTVDVFNYPLSDSDENAFEHNVNGGDGVVRVIQAITQDDGETLEVVAVGQDANIYTISPAGGGRANETSNTINDSILGLANLVSLPNININTSSPYGDASFAIVNYNSSTQKFAGATAISSANGFAVQGTSNTAGLVGLAAASGTSGSNVSVTISGVNSSQTDLTPGNIYLLQDDGTLEAYEDGRMESGVQIGTAISSTEIIFNPFYAVTGG
jgi:hypothetical protein